jgi:hypothetical protein
MSTFASNYQVFEIVFYPIAPTPSTLPQSIQMSDTSEAAVLTDVLALYPSAVIISAGPVTQSGSICLPSAISAGTTSPATLYCVTFYATTPAPGVIQEKIRVLANNQAQAWSVLLSSHPSAVMISITPNADSAPATVSLQTA